ncbi:Serine/threonine-protein kinase [Brettanomyces nanus]|uniref:Serine/threonine-protein kinase ATG1 n=1 Tax=Eeniella nana TaxID=13502 RepID=A0A875RQ98_EENNA|nr:Serine/threonine-protein kinase [Brettanomyces nanus]QPG76280.1 Serine/threonine-protein kinase [Brettanomyces nanus]
MTDLPSNKVVGNFKIGPEIGRGSFANVYKGYDRRTNQPVAVKSVFRNRLKNQKLIDNLEVEISILKNLKNPHIVALLECVRTDQYFHLFMEYCSLGDLSYFIKQRDQLAERHPLVRSILQRYPSPPNSHGMNEVLVINFIKQLASALKFLRSQNLVHRDIKPQNLLLCPPTHSKEQFETKGYAGLWELPILKIADFGFARFLPSTSMAETLCGSPLYMAPEILRYEKYNAKADLWSVGAVIYEMAVGKPPFRAANHVELLKKIENAKDQISFPASAQVPQEIMRLICSLLKADPTERMGFAEFFDDPLVVCEVKRTDEPLTCALDDEHLFISEYLPKKSVTKKNIITTAVPETIKEEPVATTKVAIHPSSPTAKDDIIKSIITKSSPPPKNIKAGLKMNGKAGFSNSRRQASDNDDVIYEKDYVVVEKRTVEVNALADELNEAGSGVTAISPNDDKYLSSAHRYSSSSRSSSNASSHRKPSFSDRKTPLSISPTNALSKALGYTSSRLFGSDHQAVPRRRSSQEPQSSEQQQQRAVSAARIFEEKMLNPSGGSLGKQQQPPLRPIHSTGGKVEDSDVISRLEVLGTMAHAVSLFAEVKFSQLIPMPPSTGSLDRVSPKSSVNNVDIDPLPPFMVKSISEEGVALYVKTLSLLAQAMSVASEWWHQNAVRLTASPRLNELVQWIRLRFNESLEKAEFLRLKLAYASERISVDDPRQKDSVVAEKLIFDRALEMSRSAAMNELKNQDFYGCELSYATAIWMLEALLNNKENLSSSKSLEKLDSEDRKTVELFIDSIGNRLKVLRQKIELQNAKG